VSSTNLLAKLALGSYRSGTFYVVTSPWR